jgi:membrane-bound lytic murein transglycosylase MltF
MRYTLLPQRVGLTVLALCAGLCGAVLADPEPNPSGASFSLDTSGVEKPWSGDLDGMIQRGYIRILTVHSKTTYFSDRGVLRGTVVDFARLFEDGLNRRLAAGKLLKNRNLKVRVVFIPMQRDQLLPSLAAGKGDIAAANLTITPGRLKLVDFTSSRLGNVNEVVVTGPGSPAIASVDDLSGKPVFVRKSSSYYESLTELNKRFTDEGKPPVVLKQAPESLEDEDLLEMVNAGLVPLVIVDDYMANFWKQIFPKIVVHTEVAVRTGGEIGWAIRKGSPQLKAALNEFVSHNREGTANGNEILRRYLKSVKYVKDAASEAERKKFRALMQYFQKYGTQYDVDWVLMGAQGYQESQLNQDAKSKVGAIGVMQLMPATGKAMSVGDIHEAEANINAGIKYMRFMINRYYSNEPMTSLNKALFTFASYNAGPARIAQLRQEAKRRGLDPNVWFGNVEYVAADKIGQETVTYVSNIYKYYVAYRLLLEGKAIHTAALAKARGASN